MCLVAVGSNVTSQFGTPRQTLELLVNTIPETTFRDVIWSRFYATPAHPVGSGPDYINAAFKFETTKSAPILLQELHKLEQQFGRVRAQRWGPRILDLDLIACGDQILPGLTGFLYWTDLTPSQQQEQTPDQVILPHPRLQDRSFVLRPLLDIAADWRHPVYDKTIRDMLTARPTDEQSSVVPV